MPKRTFVGRNEALDKLKRLLRKKSASLAVIRGRRRIGKSRLVEEFARDLPFYSFTGLAPTEQTSADGQRKEFARQLQDKLDLPGIRSDDWGDLLTLLAKQTAKGRVIILLDEISWMGSLDPTFLGKLNIIWDEYFSKNPQLILILCGSVFSWIEKNIISSTSFFGRITQKVYLEELSLQECNQLLVAQGFKGSMVEKLMLLALTGGVPWYIELANPSLSAIENIKRLCFEKDGVLFDEFRQIFHDLFGKRSEIYKRIVRALSFGPAQYKDIVSALNYSSDGPLSEYLDELILSGYVEKDFTWSFKTGRESNLFQYRLSDNYLRFYLKYIEPNTQLVLKKRFSKVSLTSLPGWDAMMGFQFENLVLHNRSLILDRLKIEPTDITYDNPFFQRKTAKQPGCQIDYMIQTRFKTLYLCEIKFSSRPVTSHAIDEIKEKMKRLKCPKGFSIIPVLIHVNGFCPTIQEQDFFFDHIDYADFLH